MATEIYLQLKANGAVIAGECQKDGRDDQIDVSSYSWGISRPSRPGVGAGTGAGQLQARNVTFKHVVDKASPVIAQAVGNNSSCAAIFEFVRYEEGSNTPVVYYKTTLDPCSIVSVDNGATEDDDLLVETVSLSYSKVDSESPDAGTAFVWDIKTGVDA